MNEQKYKFPEIDASKEISEYTNTLAKIEIEQKILNKIKLEDVTIGSIFDAKAFNKKVDAINELIMKKNKIKDKINLLKLKYRPIDYNKMTIDEFKFGLITDINLMINELLLMKNFNYNQFNNIINKNYRKLTILILLLLLFIISYYLYNFLSN